MRLVCASFFRHLTDAVHFFRPPSLAKNICGLSPRILCYSDGNQVATALVENRIGLAGMESPLDWPGGGNLLYKESSYFASKLFFLFGTKESFQGYFGLEKKLFVFVWGDGHLGKNFVFFPHIQPRDKFYRNFVK